MRWEQRAMVRVNRIGVLSRGQGGEVEGRTQKVAGLPSWSKAELRLAELDLCLQGGINGCRVRGGFLQRSRE